jgi:GT2 family glycosyltransferase
VTPELSERLSVVLLTFNCQARIRSVLGHVRRLGVPVIAVDNASTDGTVDVLREMSWSGLEVIQCATNLGAAARNLGVQRAPTPYVAFCDDDGWYDPEGLGPVCDLFDAHPRLALVNARILAGPADRLDPICAEMAQSPLTDRAGIPGSVLLGFMAGACVVRASAYRQVGGYDPRFFIGGEEESLSLALAKAGWEMRYVDQLVAHHYPSLENFHGLRAYGMRNTLWSAWLHRRLGSALRYTAFTLLDAPKDRSYVTAIRLALSGARWVARERRPMSRDLDARLRMLDDRRYANRRRFLTFTQPGADNPPSWPAADIDPADDLVGAAGQRG